VAVGRELVTIALYAGAYQTAVDLAAQFARDPAAGLEDVVRYRGLAAVALRYLGRAPEARAAALEAARLCWETRIEHDWQWGGIAVLGEMLTYSGESEAAATVHRWTLDVVLDFNPGGLMDTLVCAAHLATVSGGHAVAAELLGASDAACNRAGYQLPRGFSAELVEQILAGREALGAQAFHEAWTRGSRLGDVGAAMRAHAVLDEIDPSSRWHDDDAIAALLSGRAVAGVAPATPATHRRRDVGQPPSCRTPFTVSWYRTGQSSSPGCTCVTITPTVWAPGATMRRSWAASRWASFSASSVTCAIAAWRWSSV
jgi:hypothetical protein